MSKIRRKHMDLSTYVIVEWYVLKKRLKIDVEKFWGRKSAEKRKNISKKGISTQNRHNTQNFKIILQHQILKLKVWILLFISQNHIFVETLIKKYLLINY